mmetsp:Transcript_25518/g.60707  ORF Transcript_25518/g.60707 Transcript_25518/m.60707 type:complete len:112 (+) Transcript_25518:612-947(+)
MNAGRYDIRHERAHRLPALRGRPHREFGHAAVERTDHRDIHLGHQLGHAPGSRYGQRAAEGAEVPHWPRPGQLASTQEHHWGDSMRHRAALRGARGAGHLGGYRGTGGRDA